eukprot:UN02330
MMPLHSSITRTTTPVSSPNVRSFHGGDTLSRGSSIIAERGGRTSSKRRRTLEAHQTYIDLTQTNDTNTQTRTSHVNKETKLGPRKRKT